VPPALRPALRLAARLPGAPTRAARPFAKQFQAEAADFMKKNSGTDVKINAVEHNTFQENINNYLQGSPDDVFTWFAGYR
jgi:ABC-type glycerol-3-phosphate transport system substrate-binding protein